MGLFDVTVTLQELCIYVFVGFGRYEVSIAGVCDVAVYAYPALNDVHATTSQNVVLRLGMSLLRHKFSK
jgi:hypothetical protein